MTNLLITGASGVLGANLINGLCDTDFTIYALGRNLQALQEKFQNKKNVRLCTGLDDVPLDRVDCVVHCAFARSQNGADLADSIDFSQKIFNTAVQHNIPAVINISSQSIYGAYRETPSTEDGPVNPLDMYAVAKYACEKLSIEISKNTKTKITNLRLSSLIGPEFSERVVYKMIESAIKTKTIKVVGGNQVFSFLDISDAADGIATMLKTSSDKWANVYNLATDERYTILEMANQIADVVKNTNIDFTPAETHQLIQTNPNRFFQDFGWRAKIKLKDAVVKIVQNIK